MKITNAIVWDHRGRVPDGGKGQLEIRVTIDRKSYYFGTGIKVHKSEFVAGRIVNCTGADVLNDRITILYTKVLACVNACVRDSVGINTEEIRRQVWQVIELQSDESTFLNWMEQQIPKLDVKEGTRRHYHTTLTRLTEYGKIRRWQDITVENIVDFDYWLHQLTPKGHEGSKAYGRLSTGLSNGAIWNYHKNLKAMLQRAYKFDKINSNPYEKLEGQFDRGAKESVEYLTEDEMTAIMNLRLTEGTTLDMTRDLFVFQMWTGLSYSDAEAFDISQYKKVNGKWINTGERIKTGVPYISQLLHPVIEVLEKYDWKTPQINNVLYNKMLKAIGEMAGIKTRMHSHLARHTFATYMLSNGAAIERVGKMLGQKNIRTTQRYAKVLAQDVHDDFDMVAEKMNQKLKIKNK